MISAKDKPKRVTCTQCGHAHAITYKKNGSPFTWYTRCSVCNLPLDVEPDPVWKFLKGGSDAVHPKRSS